MSGRIRQRVVLLSVALGVAVASMVVSAIAAQIDFFDGSRIVQVTSTNPLPVAVSGGGGSTSIGHGSVTCGVAATQFPSNAVDSFSVMALAANGAPAYVGGSGVTVGAGFELAPGGGLSALTTDNTNDLWCISASGTEVVRFLRLQ